MRPQDISDHPVHTLPIQTLRIQTTQIQTPPNPYPWTIQTPPNSDPWTIHTPLTQALPIQTLSTKTI